MYPFYILAVSHRSALRATIRKAAETADHIRVSTASSLEDAKQVVESSVFDLAIVDLSIERGRSVDFLLGLRHAFPNLSILVVTDKHLQDYDREAIKLGIDGFLVQPVRSEHVHFHVSRVREIRRLREQFSLPQEERAGLSGFEEFVGTSNEIRRVLHQLTQVASLTLPVALYGETGTGKELAARAIHRLSPRRERPFVAVNSASIPETLLESELFGHARGAFTDARAERAGYIEAAQGGTLFLDEIGDLPLPMQGKLLRVIQERTLHRIGSSKPILVDFRLVTATNRDLLDDVRAGRFREDLFYRLHVFPIHLPPLRFRRSDIPILADYFLRKYSKELARTVLGFDTGALEALMSYSWPGNVRELQNTIHRIVATKKNESVVHVSDVTHFVDAVRAAPPPPRSPEVPPTHEIKPLRTVVRDYVRWAFDRLDRNKARTARLLEIERATLYRKLAESDDPERSGI